VHHRRTGDRIIQGGVNVHPQEIIDVVRGMPDIEDCAVVGVPDAYLGEAVVVAAVRRPGSALTSTEVLAWCRTHMDTRRLPVWVKFLSELPRNEIGKIRTAALRDAFAAVDGDTSNTPFVAALSRTPVNGRRTAVRDMLSGLVAGFIDGSIAAPISVEQSATFGQLGFDSLRAVGFSRALAEVVGRPVPATLTFNHPTLDAVCDYLLRELFAHEPAPAAVSSQRRFERCSIAIVGVACRLPGGVQSPESFWTLLSEGRDATCDITRWDIDALYRTRPVPAKPFARRAALLDAINAFDSEFFELSQREARSMDPRHRLVLETTWEAFENAGYDPRPHESRPIGTFLGMSGAAHRGDATIGDVPAMAVGRICDFFDMRGPATVVDTTCSSSLFAIHLAVQSLRLGECDVALAGGVHVISSPGSFVRLGEMGLLASDGRSKAFAADADGYGRGEGCAMLVLKRLSDASTDRDHVMAIIRGTAARHDGRSSSLTAPNGSAQQDVIRAALADAGIHAMDVDYLEAHGAGTPLGDPIEIEAATAIFGTRDRPIVIGSVKTNIGHLEAAAGAAAILKVALSLEHRAIPPHLHCDTLNPRLQPFCDRFAIPTTMQRWPTVTGRRHIAGVSSMGLSGTNVHIVLESAPESVPAKDGDLDDRPIRADLLCLSARNEAALRRQQHQYAEHLTHIRPSDFAACCYTARAGRAHFAHRIAVVAATPTAARALLTNGADPANGRRVRGIARQRPKIAFLFTGQGTQHVGMGHELYQSEPVFRGELERCARRLDALLPRPLLALLYEDCGSTGSDRVRLDDMECAQPALCALQWSLYALWRSWGIEPDFVLGHSLGECAAACAAGLLTPEDGLFLAATRGHLLQTLSPAGAMVAIKTDVDRVREIIGDGTGDVAVAAHNGPTSTVISGRSEAVAAAVAVLAAQGVESRPLAIPRASHSPLVDPVLRELERVAAGLTYAAPRTTFVSTLSGLAATFEELSQPTYWSRQMRQPVQFASAIRTLITAGCEVFVEIGPHPTLISLGQDCAATLSGTQTWLSTLHRERDAREQVLETLAELYVRGIDPDWRAVHGGRARRIALPTYPFERPRVDSHKVSGQRTGDSKPNVDGVLGLIRARLAEAIGVPADSIGIEDNVLSMGMDSLRVLDFLSAVRGSLGVSLAPADLMAHPTIASFAALLLSRIEVETTTSRPLRRAATAPSSTGPLVTLNARGSAIPLFCLHPSGGQVTAYLRFQPLLGNDQPLFAIQSRALAAPYAEHLTIEAMATDYAMLVQSVQSAGPYRLLGWSMGGIVAHAIAGELERRGERVDLVGMIDAIETRAKTDLPRPFDTDTVFALVSMLQDLQPSLPASHLVAEALHDESGRELFARDPYAWFSDHDLLHGTGQSRHAFAAMVRLYKHHFQLVRDHQPSIIDAPLLQWRSDVGTSIHDWSRCTRGGLRERTMGGTHFSIVQPPSIGRIAAELADFVAAASVDDARL
jgi:acyl transferase domain-containing protein